MESKRDRVSDAGHDTDIPPSSGSSVRRVARRRRRRVRAAATSVAVRYIVAAVALAMLGAAIVFQPGEVMIIGMLFLVPYIIFLISPVILAHSGDAAEERARREIDRSARHGRHS